MASESTVQFNDKTFHYKIDVSGRRIWLEDVTTQCQWQWIGDTSDSESPWSKKTIWNLCFLEAWCRAGNPLVYWTLIEISNNRLRLNLNPRWRHHRRDFELVPIEANADQPRSEEASTTTVAIECSLIKDLYDAIDQVHYDLVNAEKDSEVMRSKFLRLERDLDALKKAFVNAKMTIQIIVMALVSVTSRLYMPMEDILMRILLACFLVLVSVMALMK